MILFVPTIEKGRGGGHFVRCSKFVQELQALGIDAFLYDKKNKLPDKKWELIILDNFQTSCDELEKWKRLAPVIGIDEGGVCRDSFDFLIDILPNLEKIKPNISDIGFLPLSTNSLAQRRRSAGDAEKIRVLISFGLEDAAGLGKAVFDSLSNDKTLDITFANKENFIPNLSEHLHEYDIVFTHFGITAYEALYAGTQVILINPTPYHEKLSKKAGIKTIKKISALSAPLRLRARYICKYNSISLPKLLTTFSPHINRRCPVCGATPPARAIARFTDRTYRLCQQCGIIFMDRLTPAPINYGKEYFFEEYQKQYGKTYLEDFDNLKKIAKRRLKTLAQRRGGAEDAEVRILDIGCAYGAFLAAAKEEGFEPYGIDPCKEAVEYVQRELGILATQGFFPSPQSPVPSPFSIITLWFTLEHFQDCIPVFKEIKKLLTPNGMLAFSTPSFSGISGRKNLRRFLQNSPADHFTIWSPKSCKKALSLAGFKVVKIVNCGHHPERFPLLGKLACCKYSPVYWLLLGISKLFMLGDTFEVYAVNSLSHAKTQRRKGIII